jgi:preprotein translocase subunit SecD
MIGSLNLNLRKKAGLFGLFCCAGLLLAGVAAAEPLAIKVVAAQVEYDTRNNEPVVAFKMSDASKKAFAELTRANVGHKLAIRVDGKTMSAPIIREPILGGAGQIAGRFTVQQASDLAARLSSGAAKLEMEIVD